MITLTEKLIESLRTPKGGFNQATMEYLGTWPLQPGWKHRLIGTAISEKNFTAAKAASLKKRHFFRGNTRRHRR